MSDEQDKDTKGLSSFNAWFVNFLDAEKVDIETVAESKNGKPMKLADVITRIVQASDADKERIRAQLETWKRFGGDASEMLRTYAGAWNV